MNKTTLKRQNCKLFVKIIESLAVTYSPLPKTAGTDVIREVTVVIVVGPEPATFGKTADS